jgi:hypothetical protein
LALVLDAPAIAERIARLQALGAPRRRPARLAMAREG